ncbi:MAG TPA: hypothetical protein VFZ78_09695 [Flavisolibacter sp.]
MKTISALEGGLAGAAALTLIHEAIKSLLPKAPRMDLLGKEAIAKTWHKVDGRVPEKKLYTMALAGDLVSNALYYSFAGIGKKQHALIRGAALGLAAGVGAVVLPGKMGLSERHSSRTLETRMMTIGLYVIGGIVAAGVMRFLERRKQQDHHVWEHRLVTSAMG